MPANHNDPRVRKTRRGLRDALLRLIVRNGYDAITIRDIAEEADMARVTFYRHYLNKEELLADCLDKLYEELGERTPPITLERLQSGYSPVRNYFEHLEEQKELYRILFTSRRAHIAHNQMRHHLAQRVQEILARHESRAVPSEIMAYYVAGALMGLGRWWLEHDVPYSAHHMADMALYITMGAIRQITDADEKDFDLPQLPPNPRKFTGR